MAAARSGPFRLRRSPAAIRHRRSPTTLRDARVILGQVVDRPSPITGPSPTFATSISRRGFHSDWSHVSARTAASVFRPPPSGVEPERPVHRLVLVVEAPGSGAGRTRHVCLDLAMLSGRYHSLHRAIPDHEHRAGGRHGERLEQSYSSRDSPGALTTTVPYSDNALDQREDFPAPLPSSTLTMYGMELSKGTLFAVPVTVRIANTLEPDERHDSRSGFYNLQEGHWTMLGEATWDGSRFCPFKRPTSPRSTATRVASSIRCALVEIHEPPQQGRRAVWTGVQLGSWRRFDVRTVSRCLRSRKRAVRVCVALQL